MLQVSIPSFLLGEVLCGDEKLFRFTGKGGIVRKGPNKPAKVGIWHYQGTVMYSNGEPFLVYTRVLIRQVTWERAPRPQVLSWSGQIWCRSLINQP